MNFSFRPVSTDASPKRVKWTSPHGSKEQEAPWRQVGDGERRPVKKSRKTNLKTFIVEVEWLPHGEGWHRCHSVHHQRCASNHSLVRFGSERRGELPPILGDNWKLPVRQGQLSMHSSRDPALSGYFALAPATGSVWAVLKGLIMPGIGD